VKFDIGDIYETLQRKPKFFFLNRGKKNLRHFTWRSKYVYIVDNNEKYFVALQRKCDSLLRFQETFNFVREWHITWRYTTNAMLSVHCNNG